MNKIILLKYDGLCVTKIDRKIKKSDIQQSEYILIPSDTTNMEFRNYIIIKPSKYLLFDKAIIEYQIGAFYYDEDDTCNTENFVPLEPIHMEIDSICNLFRCINCVDKFNVVNNISKDMQTYNNIEFGVLYVSIQIFQNSKEIYNKYYQKKGTSTVAYDSYKVTKKFEDIYDSNICGEMFKKDNFIMISKSEESTTWDLMSDTDGVLLIGIPLLQSNTISFTTIDEFKSLKKYRTFNYNFYVYYIKSSDVSELSQAILQGSNLKNIVDIIENYLDVYISICDGRSYSKRHRNYLIDFLSHTNFILSTINLIYSELYPYNAQITNENGNRDTYEFDCTLCIRLINRIENVYKDIIMNKNTQISFSDILSSL